MSLSAVAAKQIAQNSGTEVTTILLLSPLWLTFSEFLIYKGYKGLQSNEAKLKLGVKISGDKAALFNKFKIVLGIFGLIK